MNILKKSAIALSIAGNILTAGALSSYFAKESVLSFAVDHKSSFMTKLAITEGASPAQLMLKKAKQGDFSSVAFIIGKVEHPYALETPKISEVFYEVAKAHNTDALKALETYASNNEAAEFALFRMADRLDSNAIFSLVKNITFSPDAKATAIVRAAESAFAGSSYSEDGPLKSSSVDNASYIINCLVQNGANVKKAIDDLSYVSDKTVSAQAIDLLGKAVASDFLGSLPQILL